MLSPHEIIPKKQLLLKQNDKGNRETEVTHYNNVLCVWHLQGKESSISIIRSHLESNVAIHISDRNNRLYT